MSLKIDRVQLEIVIKNDVARQELMKLEEESRKLTRELKKIPEGTDEWVKKSAEIIKVKTRMDEVIDKIGLTGLTFKELAKRSGELNMIMKNLDPTSPHYKELELQLAQVQNRMRELTNHTKEMATGMQKSSGMMGGIVAKLKEWGGAMAAAFSVYAITNFFKTSLEKYKEMEVAEKKLQQSVENRGAVYGWTSGEIKKHTEELKKQAAELEKLGTVEEDKILGAVTDQLLTFNKITEENFKRAQVAVLDISTKLSESGVPSFGEMQGMALKLGKALENPISGMTMLARSGVQFSEQEKKVIKDLAEHNKLGEAQAMILDLVNQKFGGQYAKMKEGMGAMDMFKNSVTHLSEAIGQGMAGSVISVAKGLTSLIDWITRNIEGIKTFAKWVGITGVGVGAYALVVNGATIATTIWTAVTKAAKAAQEAFNLATKASPIGIIIALVTAAAAAYFAFRDNVNAATKASQALNDARAEGEKNIVSERRELEKLVNTANNEKLSKEARQSAIEKLNKLSPEYLGNLSLETIKTNEGTEAIKKYIEALIKKAEVTALESGIEEQMKRQQDIKIKGQETEAKWYQTTWNFLTSMGNAGTMAYKQATSEVNNQNGALKESNIILESLKKKLEEVSETPAKIDVTKGKTLTDLKQELKDYQDAREQIDISDKAAMDENQKLIDAKQAEIDKYDSKKIKSAQETADKLTEINIKAKDDFQKIMDDIINLDAENLAKKQSETEKEIRMINEKYDKEIEALKKYAREYDKNTPEGKKKYEALSPEQKKNVDNVPVLIKDEQIKKTDEMHQLLENKEAEFTKDIIDLKEKMRVAVMSIQEKEVYEINKSYDEKIKELRDSLETEYQMQLKAAGADKNLIDKANQYYLKKKEDLKSDESKLNEARNMLIHNSEMEGEKRFQEELSQVKEKNINRLYKTEKEKAIIEIKQRYEKLLESHIAGQERIEQELKKLKKQGGDQPVQEGDSPEMVIIKDKYQKELELATTTAERIKVIKESMAKDIAAKELEIEKKKQRAILATSVTVMNKLVDTVFAINKENNQREVDDKVDALEKQKTKELSNKKLTDKQKAAIEEKYHQQEAALKKEAWEKEQKAAITMAIIKGALAIVTTFAEMGWPAGIAGAIIVAATTAAEVATIANQKAPQFWKGKYPAEIQQNTIDDKTKEIIKQKILKGEIKSEDIYAEAFNSRTQRIAGGKMPVIGSSDNILYNADMATVQTGIYQKPTALVGEKGPELVFDADTTKNIQLNAPELLEMMNYYRVPQHGIGLYPAQVSSSKSQVPSSNMIMVDKDVMMEMVAANKELNAHLKRGIKTGPVKFPLFDFNREQQKLQDNSDSFNMYQTRKG